MLLLFMLSMLLMNLEEGLPPEASLRTHRQDDLGRLVRFAEWRSKAHGWAMLGT